MATWVTCAGSPWLGRDERTDLARALPWRVQGQAVRMGAPASPRRKSRRSRRRPTGRSWAPEWTPSRARRRRCWATARHIYFTTPHFDGYPAILVRLDRIAVEPELHEAIVEAWLRAGAEGAGASLRRRVPVGASRNGTPLRSPWDTTTSVENGSHGLRPTRPRPPADSEPSASSPSRRSLRSPRKLDRTKPFPTRSSAGWAR